MPKNIEKVLAITNAYPTVEFPFLGTFFKQQVESLKSIGLDVDLVFADRNQEGIKTYWNIANIVQHKIATFKPDIVHILYGGVLANQIIQRSSSTPTVISFCGSDLLLEPIPGIVRQSMRRYGIFASYQAAKKADGLIVKSSNLLDELSKKIKNKPIAILPNGVDLDRFKVLDQSQCQKKLGFNPQYFHILFPTNAGSPVKRIELAKKAVEILNQKNIPTLLHELKGVAHEDVSLWLNASDVVILTSQYEGSPNIVKEALACDRNVVSVDVGDVKERLHKIAGCYIASDNADDLAQKLLLSREFKRIKGRKQISHLSLENVAKNIKTFYEQTIQDFTLRHTLR